MQKLYEQHKVLTYPRTDSRYISSDIVGTLPERLKACGIGEYLLIAGKILNKPIKTTKAFVDDSKVSESPCNHSDRKLCKLLSLHR